jgi:hypothetical protein
MNWFVREKDDYMFLYESYYWSSKNKNKNKKNIFFLFLFVFVKPQVTVKSQTSII